MHSEPESLGCLWKLPKTYLVLTGLLSVHKHGHALETTRVVDDCVTLVLVCTHVRLTCIAVPNGG